MARRSKVVFCLLLAFLYVVVNICPLRAEALPDVMSGSTTLADNIMTYYALSGSAVANTDWINTLYNSYGSSFGTIEELANQGYLVLNDAGMWEPVEQLGQMIEQAPAYSSLGLNEIFNVSSADVAAGGGLAVASGGSILAGSLGGVASTGIVPLFGGVTAAYWGGISIGTLCSHIIDKYIENIASGQKINEVDVSNVYQNTYPNGVNGTFVSRYNDRFVYCFESGIILCYYISGSTTSLWACNPTNTLKYYKSVNNNGVTTTAFAAKSKKFINSPTDPKYVYWGIKFSSLEDLESAFSAWNDGQNVPNQSVTSPDIIGENGNQKPNYDNDNGNYTVPDIKPMIDSGTQAGKPLTLEDWLAFANAVQNNNNNTAPSGSPDNQSLFDNILDIIRTVIPDNIPNPNPNPNPDPWSPPVVTPVPDPSYPDPVPDQQITENPQESENPQQTEDPIDTGKPWRLPDLRNKFPFCIPWDIGKIFTKLKVNARQAPHISWRFNPPNTPIDYTFNLDLEDFEEAAALLRTLELMGFIVGLAFVTRYLIGAN